MKWVVTSKNLKKQKRMELKIYAYFLPIIGLVIPCAVILFGAVLFGKKRAGESDELSKLGILLSPLRDAPLWVWLIAILGYVPLIIHSVDIWNPEIPYISCLREIFDTGSVILLFSYLIVCCIAIYKREKKKREAKEKEWGTPTKKLLLLHSGGVFNFKGWS